MQETRFDPHPAFAKAEPRNRQGHAVRTLYLCTCLGLTSRDLVGVPSWHLWASDAVSINED